MEECNCGGCKISRDPNSGYQPCYNYNGNAENVMELKSLLDPDVVDLVARKHWERKSHPLMKKHGYPTDWPNLSKSLKRECRNIVTRIIKTAFAEAKANQKT